ncbi:hypothetical protein [Roseivirga pacifica]|uniref:hypothetical protein n=1 Tax=Roseivirga pacifica TaxID=1267423 RepID=UPI003BAEF9D6
MSSPYPLKLKRFKKKSGIDFTLTSFRLSFHIPILLLGLVLLKDYFGIGLNINDAGFLCICCYLGGFIWGRREQEHKHGEFNGHVEFSKEGFNTDSKVLLWSETEIAALKSSHVFRDDIYSHMNMLGPKYSLGVDNFIEFKTGNETGRVYFQFSDYKDKRKFEKIIRDQFYKGNIDLSVAYDGLSLTYEEIQVLKEEAKSKKNNANQQQYLQ